MKLIGNKWDEVLEEEYQKPYFDDLINKVDHEYKVSKVYPAPNKIFASLKYTDYDDVKVVILGQDPYHGAGQAHGVAFSVLPGIKTPMLLQSPWQYTKYYLRAFHCLNAFLLRQNCLHLTVMDFRVIFGF